MRSPTTNSKPPDKSGAHGNGSAATIHQRWSVLAACVCAGAAGFLAFAPALHNEFVYDDLAIIVNNPTIRYPGPWYRFWKETWWPRGSIDALYRPLTVASFRVNTIAPDALARALSSPQARPIQDPSEPNPYWFHLVNLAIHALTSIGVALLSYRLSGRAWAAWTAGLLFAVHPIHTEAVVTGYGRAELLAGFFSVWLLVVHMKAARFKGASDDGHCKPTILSILLQGILFLFALMSKEHALFIWPVIMLLDLWQRSTVTSHRVPLRSWLNDVAPAHIVLGLAAAAFFLLRYQVLGWHYWTSRAELTVWQAPLANATWIERILTPLRLLWLTVELCVRPGNLSPMWSLPSLPLADRLSPDVALGGLILLLIPTLAALFWQKKSVQGPILLGIIILLALPLQFIAITAWYFAERWLYLPTMLIAVALGIALAHLRGIGLLLSLAFSVFLLPASWSYLAGYHDDYALVRYVLDRQPDNYHAMKGLGNALVHRGDYLAALQQSDEMIERFGEVPEAYMWRARSHWALHETKETLTAIKGYHRAMGTRISFELDALEQEAQQALATAPSR